MTFEACGGVISWIFLGVGYTRCLRPGEACYMGRDSRPPGSFASPWERGGLAPVSYTHLDVYKRQAQLRLKVKHLLLPAKAMIS